MVVLPDVRGLHPFYEELALRFAEHGIDAVAIDYFGRTATDEPRGEAFDHAAHIAQTTFEGLAADVRAGAAYLRSPEGGAVRSLFSVGFCFGGRLSFLAATLGLDLAGVVGFYGVPHGNPRQGMPPPVEVANRFAAPVLGLFGGADQAIPASAVAEFDAALGRAGVEHEFLTFPDAPHSFFDRRAADHADASAAAWDAILAFIKNHTAAAQA
jgi:carboxymethylenebutenolidase